MAGKWQEMILDAVIFQRDAYVTRARRHMGPDIKADLQGQVAQLNELIKELRKKPKKESTSRAARWGRAVAEASAGLSELKALQDEFEAWQGNLPENLQSSPLGTKLQEVVDLDIDSAVSTVEEAEGMDLPRGFGRD